MAEFYPPVLLGASRELYRAIRAWAEPTGRVTLIGGWAVFERVDRVAAMESRDVDLILHDEATLRAFDARLRDWDLQWGTSAKGVPMECHRVGDAKKEILVDVFTPEPLPAFFRGHALDNVKAPPPDGGFLPSVEWLLQDKVATVPLRQGREAYDKKAKDLVDIRNLVFHNSAGTSPMELMRLVPFRLRKQAAQSVPVALAHRPQFENELLEARAWLLRE